jgi:hypothetical protein
MKIAVIADIAVIARDRKRVNHREHKGTQGMEREKTRGSGLKSRLRRFRR